MPPLDRDDVEIGTLVYTHDNGVSVKLRPHDRAWEVAGTRHSASWTNRRMSGYEYGMGETIDEDELEQRKSDAISAAKEIDGVRRPADMDAPTA